MHMAPRSWHARVNGAQRVHIRHAWLFLWEQLMVLYIVVTASDDAALLITAMRGNVEHPGEDGRSTVPVKNTFPLEGLLLESAAAFLVLFPRRRRRQNVMYESEIPNDDARRKSKIMSYNLQCGIRDNEWRWMGTKYSFVFYKDF